MPDRPDDFDRRLANRLRAYEAGLPSHEAPDTTSRVPTSRRWPAFVGVAGAAVAAGAILAAVLLGGPRTEVGLATPSPTVTHFPTPVATPSPSMEPTSTATPESTPEPTSPTPKPAATPAALEELMRLDAGSRTALASALAPLGDGRLVAAVSTSEWENMPATGPHGMDGSIHIGSAGGGWQRIDTGAAFEGVDITDLFVTPSGRLVAYGMLEVFEAADGAVGFTSVDGSTWERIRDVPWASTGYADLAAGPLGYLAATTAFDDAGRGRIAVYRSDDAVTWRLAYQSPESESFDNFDVGVGSEGYVVSARQHLGDGGEGRVVTIASGDGVTWVMSPEGQEFPFETALATITAFGPDWVAAGFSGTNQGISVYWSANGLEWTRVATIEDPADREYFGYAAHLVATDDRLFLSAAFQAEGTESRPAGVWTSTDARTWSLLPLGDRTEVRAVASVPDEVIMAGRLDDSGGDAVIWRAPDDWFR